MTLLGFVSPLVTTTCFGCPRPLQQRKEAVDDELARNGVCGRIRRHVEIAEACQLATVVHRASGVGKG